jgi:hypothetical protein
MVYSTTQPATLIGPGYAPRGPAVLAQGLVVKTTHVSTELRLAAGRQGMLQRVAVGAGAGEVDAAASTPAVAAASSSSSAAGPKPGAANAPPAPPTAPRLVGVVHGAVAHSRELMASQVLNTPLPVRDVCGVCGRRGWDGLSMDGGGKRKHPSARRHAMPCHAHSPQVYSHTDLGDAAVLDALPLPVTPCLVDAFYGLDGSALREVAEYRAAAAAAAAKRAGGGGGGAGAAGSKRRRAGDEGGSGGEDDAGEGGGDGGGGSPSALPEPPPQRDLTRRLHLVMVRWERRGGGGEERRWRGLGQRGRATAFPTPTRCRPNPPLPSRRRSASATGAAWASGCTARRSCWRCRTSRAPSRGSWWRASPRRTRAGWCTGAGRGGGRARAGKGKRAGEADSGGGGRRRRQPYRPPVPSTHTALDRPRSDLKPANVLMAFSPAGGYYPLVRLCDAGSARAVRVGATAAWRSVAHGQQQHTQQA